MNIPQHVGFIMDGNSSWAKKLGKSAMYGYRAGFESFLKTIENSSELGIKYATCYAFSSENWNRPKQWLQDFFALGEELFCNNIFLDRVMKIDGKVKFIGNISKFAQSFQDIMRNIEEKTKNNNGITVFCALSYGGRDEIVRAANKAVSLGIEITEKSIAENLDTAQAPDPDLIIRTSNKMRLSNFLLWQISYSEFYFSKVYWPEFDKTALNEAVEEYSSRKRTFGG